MLFTCASCQHNTQVCQYKKYYNRNHSFMMGSIVSISLANLRKLQANNAALPQITYISILRCQKTHLFTCASCQQMSQVCQYMIEYSLGFTANITSKDQQKLANTSKSCKQGQKYPQMPNIIFLYLRKLLANNASLLVDLIG